MSKKDAFPYQPGKIVQPTRYKNSSPVFNQSGIATAPSANSTSIKSGTTVPLGTEARPAPAGDTLDFVSAMPIKLRFCTKCGTKIPEDDEMIFCSNCGARFKKTT
jgi:hypothetical protein